MSHKQIVVIVIRRNITIIYIQYNELSNFTLEIVPSTSFAAKTCFKLVKDLSASSPTAVNRSNNS